MPFGLFSKKGNQGIDYKARLEHKLYLARENPEPVFDLADCALKAVPQGIYSLCKVFRKDVLYLQENQLTSLSGGGSLMDLSLLQVLDLHSNHFAVLPDDIKYLKNLKVLNVSKNHLKYLPEAVGELDKLNLLNVSSNNLKSVPEFLGKLKRLQQLDLRDNKSLRTLPSKLALAVSLKELRVTATNFTHPPAHTLEQGTVATMRFLAEELGVEYVSPADSLDDSSETSGSSSYCGMEWEEKDRLFQAKILQLERLKEQRQQELLALEKQMEEHQKRELHLQNMMKSNKGRLLEDLVEQQSKLESEILRIQQDREAERLRLVQHLQRVEQKADSVLSQMLALSAARDSKQLQHLLEQEQQEDERLLNIAHEEYKSLHRKDVLNAMETLLEEECKREKKLREYEEGRAEVTRTLLSREVEADRQLQEMLSTQEQLQSQLVGRLQKDEELQRAAVAALLERSDARSWGLVHQVALVQAQLAALTAVEMERKKLEMTEQVKEISEKRLALSCLLMDLLNQQAERRQQLLNTLNEMEKRRWVDEENSSKDGDFWLRQYQRLLDSRPVNLIDMEKSLDPMLAQHLVLCGAIHCLPFLTQWIHSKEALKGLTDADLKKAHVSLSEDRDAILQAVRLYLEECELAKRKLDDEPHPNTSPTAPPIEEAEQPPAVHISAAECVICMDAQCEVIFVPCGHMCTCIKCAEAMAEGNCPMCRNTIDKKIRVILP